MASKKKKITLSQLLEMLRNEEVTDSEIRPYLIVDANQSTAFNPAITFNPELVEADPDQEGDVLVSAFNWLSKRRRQKKYRKKIAAGYTGIRIVSEGDSWFQYPLILDDVIDQLFEDYAIFSLGGAGHLLQDMIDEDEISEAIRKERPDIFLVSGGGNDMVGDARLATMVERYDKSNPNRPAGEYLNANFDIFIDDMSKLYRGLFKKLHEQFPWVIILTHGYDWALADKGSWLGKPLAKQGIKNKSLQSEIVRVMIDRFNVAVTQLSEEFRNVVFHVDCRGAVDPASQWHDELHPTNEGYASVSERFRSKIKHAISTLEADAPEPLCPGREKQLGQAKNLGNMDFDQLSLRRARRRKVKVPPSESVYHHKNCRAMRRNAETEISKYYEKIDLSSDFLKARFLKDGTEVSNAVCRIKTPVSLGSGFLIASNNFVMTNNHVLGDFETAAASRAQFGFEDNGSLVEVNLKPNQFFMTNEELDYTIVACDSGPITNIEAIPLLRSPVTVTRKERVNIIQHPRGREKEVAIRNNEVILIQDHVIHYRTDTEPGSSGSAVFNDDWQLVALHHAGWAEGHNRAVNEGIRMASIVADLTTRLHRESEASNELAYLVNSVPDTSPYRGFFDLAGIADFSTNEVEVPEFRGQADFADIMFWNIEHFNNRVSDTRVGRVADVIDSFAMDVMGLVEVQEGAMGRLKNAMRDRGADTDYEILNVPGAQDLAVLYNRETSKVNLRQDLNDKYRPQLSTRTSGGKTAFPRHPLFAHCRVEAENTNPIEFLMIVLHLKAFGDATSRARRKLAAEILVEIIKDIREGENLAVIMGGDYNDILNTNVFASLQNSPDLFALTADDSNGGATTYVGGGHHSVIDHIVISSDLDPVPISGDDAAIVRLDRSMRNFTDQVSDHVPLAMRLVARDGGVVICPEIPNETKLVKVPNGSTSVKLEFE